MVEKMENCLGSSNQREMKWFEVERVGLLLLMMGPVYLKALILGCTLCLFWARIKKFAIGPIQWTHPRGDPHDLLSL